MGRWFAIAGLGLSALGAIVLMGPAARAEEISWSVSKNGGQCSLTRSIAGSDPVAISVSSEAGSYTFDLTVGVKKLPRRLGDYQPVTVSFDGTNQTLLRSGIQGRTANKLESIRISDIPAAAFSAFGKASGLKISYADTSLAPIALPDAAEAFDVLQDCLGRQLMAMGADPAQFEPGGSRPEPLKPSEDFLTLQQMRQALGAGLGKGSSNSLIATFKLMIDAKGAISTCSATNKGRGDQMVCAMLAGQILFRPARSPSQQGVTGVATYKIELIARKDYL